MAGHGTKKRLLGISQHVQILRTVVQKPKFLARVFRVVSKRVRAWWARYRNFLKRRPHRSFRLTHRRDMPMTPSLPSNIFFSGEVVGIIRRNWRSYVIFLLVYLVLFTMIAGIVDQDTYASLNDSIQSVVPSLVDGQVSKFVETVALFGAVMVGGVNASLSEVQQLLVTILGLYTWLSIVWFLRHRLKNVQVKVRDALYSAGAPSMSLLIVSLVGLFQLLPGAIGVLIYSTALSAQAIHGGVESMLFAIATGILVLLSLYWVTSTLLAMVVVTIPGTYPFRALSMAGDIVVGRRSSLLLRLVWLVFLLVIIWAFVLIPMILLADVLPWKWFPLVPVTVQMLSGASIVFSASYVYLLYRRMIDVPVPKRSNKTL